MLFAHLLGRLPSLKKQKKQIAPYTDFCAGRAFGHGGGRH
jgi:hypothetical protein